jgi:hypothetical protein
MRFLIAFVAFALFASPALALDQPSIDAAPECCGCNDCQCDNECLCPTYLESANGKRVYLKPVAKHPILAAAHGAVEGLWLWVVPQPKRVWEPVEVVKQSELKVPAEVVRRYKPLVIE